MLLMVYVTDCGKKEVKYFMAVKRRKSLNLLEINSIVINFN
jgi:hypothetical protein